MVLGEWNTEKQHHGKIWHPKAFGSTGISLCLQHMSCQKRLSNVFLMCTWRGTNGCMMLSYTQREYIGDDVWQKRERNVLFNDALNTFYLRLYGVRHMVKNHSDSEKDNPLPPHSYSYRLTARVILHAPSHIQDNTYHGLCYTSRGALAGTRNSSMGPPNEGSIRLPIAPWANALPLSYVPLRVWQRPVSFSSSMVSGVAFVPASWASVGAMLDLIAVPLIKHFLIIIIVIILFCTSSLARAFTLYWAVILGLSLAWTTRPLLVMKRAISIEVDDIIVHCCLGATQYSSNLSFCVSFSI